MTTYSKGAPFYNAITTIALLRAYDTCLKYDARRSTVAERLDRVAEQPALEPTTVSEGAAA